MGDIEPRVGPPAGSFWARVRSKDFWTTLWVGAAMLAILVGIFAWVANFVGGWACLLFWCAYAIAVAYLSTLLEKRSEITIAVVLGIGFGVAADLIFYAIAGETGLWRFGRSLVSPLLYGSAALAGYAIGRAILLHRVRLVGAEQRASNVLKCAALLGLAGAGIIYLGWQHAHPSYYVHIPYRIQYDPCGGQPPDFFGGC